MADLTWYLAMNIKPVEGEDVLVYDLDAHYIAYWTDGGAGDRGYWSCSEDGDLFVFSPEAWWTDLPRP